jgi:hypothetical protein
MVRWAVKPSLRAASCCSVEVMNGGAGLRLRCLRSTLSTLQLAVGRGWSAPARRRGRGLVGDAELLDLLAAELDQLGDEGLSPFSSVGWHRPRRSSTRALEGLDLQLALDDQAQRRALHAPGGEPAADLLPQQRREVEADQVVQRPARLLGVDQVRGQLARVGDGVLAPRAW